ncbi:hydrolase [Clostridium sp. JNZ J1-5]|nr:hydrolase [Clostridium sp.]
MKTDKNAVPSIVKQQIINLINDSGVDAKTFISELASEYNLKNFSNNHSVEVDYTCYWDSFVD